MDWLDEIKGIIMARIERKPPKPPDLHTYDVRLRLVVDHNLLTLPPPDWSWAGLLGLAGCDTCTVVECREVGEPAARPVDGVPDAPPIAPLGPGEVAPVG